MNKIGKYKILIVDDLGHGNGGWQRALRFLYNNKYIVDGPDDINDTNEYSINYRVFSIQNSETLVNAYKHLENNHNEYDIFFFDVDLANKSSKFVEGYEELLDPDDYEINIHNCGLLLMKPIPEKDSRPIIFFTGSVIAEKINLEFINKVGKKGLPNIVTNCLSDGSLFSDQVLDTINNHLIDKQIYITSSLPSDQIKEILKNLKENKLDEPCITDLSNKEWTLRSLFPQQCNLIEDYNIRDIKPSKIEDLKSEIKALIINYPSMFHEINASHDYEHFTGEMISKYIQGLIKIEFVKPKRNEKKSIQFVPVSFFFDKKKITYIDELKKSLDFLLSYDYPSLQKLGPERVQLKYDLIKTCGFYPGYLDYIFGILEHNSSKLDQTLESFNSDISSHITSFKFVYKSDFEIKEENIDLAQKNGEKAIINPRKFSGSYSEGIQDIVKIICNRYKGEFNMIINQKRLRFFIKDRELCSEIESHILNQKIDKRRIYFEFHLPRLEAK